MACREETLDEREPEAQGDTNSLVTTFKEQSKRKSKSKGGEEQLPRERVLAGHHSRGRRPGPESTTGRSRLEKRVRGRRHLRNERLLGRDVGALQSSTGRVCRCQSIGEEIQEGSRHVARRQRFVQSVLVPLMGDPDSAQDPRFASALASVCFSTSTRTAPWSKLAGR